MAAPATICVLSGDVHHTYVAEADYPRPLQSRVYQITCSPIENTIPFPMRLVFRVGWSTRVERLIRLLDRLTGVPPVPIHWHHPSGPHFGNMLSLVTFEGRSARVQFERSTTPEGEQPRGKDTGLEIADELLLTDVAVTP